jgi:hypothetical protein
VLAVHESGEGNRGLVIELKADGHGVTRLLWLRDPSWGRATQDEPMAGLNHRRAVTPTRRVRQSNPRASGVTGEAQRRTGVKPSLDYL